MTVRKTIDDLLAEALARLKRLEPEQARAASDAGALLVDIRSEAQRAADGTVPGSLFFPRNVLEWRLDPASGHADPRVAGPEAEVILMCSEGWLVPSLPWGIIGFVWAYNLAWMVVQDVVKLGLYGILDPGHSWKKSLLQPLRGPMARDSAVNRKRGE